MSEPRWEQIRDLHSRTAELPREQQAPFLKRECGGDESLRRAVEDLLAWERDDVFLEPEPAKEDLAAFAPGAVVGKYRVLRRLAEGGMSVVYLAEHVKLRHWVALKTLPLNCAVSLQRVSRFRREATIIARLRHPNIVPIHDVSQHQGIHYIVMDYIGGDSYGEFIDRIRGLSGEERQTCIRAVDYIERQAHVVAQVADALHHAHLHDVVHRDVKPTNILLEGGIRPRLTDFGIAKDGRADLQTASGQITGTAPYMSPEQARAQSSSIGAQSDVFSLGVVLYEALTLCQPFRGASLHETLHNVMHKAPTRVRSLNPSVGRDLEVICHKAIEKSPSHRYQNAALLGGDLRCFLEGRSILARSPSWARRVQDWGRRRITRVLFVVSAALAVACVVSLLWLHLAYTKRMCHATLSCAAFEAALVTLQRLNESSLQFVTLWERGPAPVSTWLEPGHYRCRFASPSGELEEASFIARAHQRVSIVVSSGRPTRPEEMILVDGEADGYVGVGRFLIDRTEVSNADYAEFMRATNHEAPFAWTQGWYRAAAASLPVVGIRWEDAQAYARWAGKRLPTAREWECAARGPHRAHTPWSGRANPRLSMPTSDELAKAQLGGAASYALYLKYARAVDDDPAPGARGLLHSATNVREFVDASDVGATVRIMGGGWADNPGIRVLGVSASHPIRSWSVKIGFRCARTVNP